MTKADHSRLHRAGHPTVERTMQFLKAAAAKSAVEATEKDWKECRELVQWAWVEGGIKLCCGMLADPLQEANTPCACHPVC